MKKLFVNSLSTKFTNQPTNLSQVEYLTQSEKDLLLKMGFESYYLGHPQEDSISLIIRASQEVLAHQNKRIDLAVFHTQGTARQLGDWPVAPFIQSDLKLSGSPAFVINSMCTSLPIATTLFRAQATLDPEYKTLLLAAGTSYFSPFSEKVSACDLEKGRGLIFGAGGAAMIISTEEGPIEIIETTLGTSYVDGQSWNIPAALTPYHYENDKLVGGGTAMLKWPAVQTTPGKEYVSPAQMVLGSVLKQIDQSVKRHDIKNLTLCHVPIGSVRIDHNLEKLTNIKITLNNSIYKKYGHVGGCDPALFMNECLAEGNKGYFCHLAFGQGYNGAITIFKI